MLIASARWLNGNELADSLGLPRVSWYYWALMVGQVLFFQALCYSHRSIPSLDRNHITRLKRMFYHGIVEAKWGLGGIETNFDFQYVPEYNTITDMGKMREIKLRKSSVETRNLRTLGVFMGVIGIGAWVSLKMASYVVAKVW
jgi:hypothetical protein